MDVGSRGATANTLQDSGRNNDIKGGGGSVCHWLRPAVSRQSSHGDDRQLTGWSSPEADISEQWRFHCLGVCLEAMARKELFGWVFIVLLGSALHFTYQASGQFWVVGVISAMNESVWEHLKLAYWPGLFWTGILCAQRLSGANNFWVGRAAALALPPVLIAVGFDAYTRILGSHSLVLDIGLFMISVAAGQLCAVLIYRADQVSRKLVWAFTGSIALMTSAFSFTSFFPPDLPLFIDNSTH